MKKGLFDRRIPTVVALLILLFAVAVSILLIQSGVFYVGKAAPDSQPQNLQITNITDTSFTVAFTTLGQIEATAVANETTTGNTIFLDDRDRQSGVKNKYYSHHITLLNLKPNTSYSFKLIVGATEYSDPSFKTTTGNKIDSPPPSQNPLFGKVLNPDGSLANDSLVIVKSDSSSVVSAYTDNNGEFILPTNSLRNKENNNFLPINDDYIFVLTAIKKDMSSSVTTTFKLAQNLPPITLLQKYVFSQKEDEQIQKTSGFGVSIQEDPQSPLTISTPEEDESFTDLRPSFAGTAIPGTTVEITVDEVFAVQILTNNVGLWTYRPSSEFSPGRYVLEVSSEDSDGKPLRASSNFAIFPQGSQVFAEELNPTTTPTPTPSPTSAPTATPTSTPSPTPPATDATTPTSTPSLTPTTAVEEPTATPLPTIPFTPTKVPPIDDPGILENTYAMTGLSMFLILVGAALLFIL